MDHIIEAIAASLNISVKQIKNTLNLIEEAPSLLLHVIVKK